MPEVFQNSQWHPICGRWFWDNNIGASLFCQQLGFDSGTITSEQRTIRLPRDGIRVGRCNIGDTWLSCTGGCNDLSVGGGQCSDCRTGVRSGVQVACIKGRSEILF